MAEPLSGDTIPARPGPLRSLASKFSVFAAALSVWVIVTMLVYDVRRETLNTREGLLLVAMVILVAGAIALFTSRLLSRPLSQLQSGVVSARNGLLEPIQVCKTGDEVEFLGAGFN